MQVKFVSAQEEGYTRVCSKSCGKHLGRAAITPNGFAFLYQASAKNVKQAKEMPQNAWHWGNIFDTQVSQKEVIAEPRMSTTVDEWRDFEHLRR